MSIKKQDKKLKEIIDKSLDIIEQTNDIDQAIQYLKSYQNEFSNSLLYCQELGCLYYENNDFENSTKFLEKILTDLNNAKYKAVLTLANIYSDQRAVSLYQIGIQKIMQKLTDHFTQETNWTLSKAELQLALLQTNLRIVCDLNQILEGIIKRDPYFLEAIYYLILFHLSSENQSKTMQTISDFITKLRYLEQNNPDEIFIYEIDFFFQITDILLEGGLFEQALMILQVIQNLISKEIKVIYLIAFCQYNLGYMEQLEETIQEINEILQYKQKEEIDQEILEAIQEIKIEYQKQKSKQNKE